MAPGTYTLLCELSAPASVEVGALGRFDLAAGWYAYTGSAFGPGGLARVDRHREVAAGERDVRHWHVDYLLGLEDLRVVRAITAPGSDAECAVAGRLAEAAASLDGRVLSGVGCSDCGCVTHFVCAPERRRFEASIVRAHRRARRPDG